jgi:flagellin-like protein
MRSVRKGLEPLIAALILIAITLIISVAVIAWFMSAAGSATGPKEELRFPAATLTVDSSTWVANLSLTIKNSGPTSVQISNVFIKENNCQLLVPSGASIASGETKTLSFQSSGCALTVGAAYRVAVITASGNSYELLVTAQGT